MEKTRDKQASSSKTSRSQTPPWHKSNKNAHLQNKYFSVDNEQEAADQNVDDEKKPVNYFYCNWYSYYTDWDNKRDDCSNNDWNSQSDWNDHERSDRSGRNDHNDVWNHTRDAGEGKGSERHDDWNSRSHDRSGGGMSGWDGGGSAGKSHDDARRKQHWNDHQRSDRNRWYDWNNNRDTGSRRWHDDRGGGSRGGDIEERNKLSVKQFAMDVDEEEDKPPAEVLQKQLQRRAARQLLRLILAESCMK